MKRVWRAAAAVTCCGLLQAASDLQKDVLAISYARERGMVAAAYRGGQVVVWDFDSGQVKHVYNAAAAKSTLNQPLVNFSAGGRRVAVTQEGESGLVSYATDSGAATVLVPRRLLVKGITAFSWSQQSDAILVAIGRDIFLITGEGRPQWQRRLETRAIITDVAWHPSESYYTVATDDGEVSTWETSSGRVISSTKMDLGGHATPVKVGWTSDDSLAACVAGRSFSVLDPETLKPRKSTDCNCLDFTWSAAGKETFVWTPPNIAVFSEAGQRTREMRTPFSGEGPIVWAGDGRLLTAFTDSTVVLRDARSGKVLRTFAP